MIDYARMQKTLPIHKAGLTRAKKLGYAAVVARCRLAVQEWEQIGAWPDNWSMFQRALDDSFYEAIRKGQNIVPVRLEDLH